jgi:hypothetical protein
MQSSDRSEMSARTGSRSRASTAAGSAIALLLWLLGASVAHAGTITVTIAGSTPTKTLTAQRDVAGTVAIGTSGGADLTVSGLVGDTVVAPGCTPASGEIVDCGPPSQYSRFVFNGTSGNDRLVVGASLTQIVEAHGGAGDDDLTSGAGADTLDGQGGDDTLNGADGNDRLSGGDGSDRLLGFAGADVVDGGLGPDEMNGGFNLGDTIDYSARTNSVRVMFGCQGFCTTGEPNEGDTQFGFLGALGGSGDDTLVGGDQPERFVGGAGRDTIKGGNGNDDLQGGSGDDDLEGGLGVDAIGGGAGDDLLDTYDGVVELAITCGAGHDLLFSDLADAYPAATDPEACEVVAPTIVGNVTLTGLAREGATIQASLTGSVAGTASTTSWQWWRCGTATCDLIPGAQASSYVPVAADVGSSLLVTMRVENEAGWAEADSAETAAIATRPVTPPPPPPPPPTAPTFRPARATIGSVRCGARTCSVKVRVTGDAKTLRAVLTRSGRTLGRTTRSGREGPLTLTVRIKRRLRPGTYRLRLTVTGKDGRTRSTSRSLRIRATPRPRAP